MFAASDASRFDPPDRSQWSGNQAPPRCPRGERPSGLRQDCQLLKSNNRLVAQASLSEFLELVRAEGVVPDLKNDFVASALALSRSSRSSAVVHSPERVYLVST